MRRMYVGNNEATLRLQYKKETEEDLIKNVLRIDQYADIFKMMDINPMNNCSIELFEKIFHRAIDIPFYQSTIFC